MNKKLILAIALISVSRLTFALDTCPDILNITFKPLSSEQSVNLCDEYTGKVLLIVNTASKCGYTYQYEGLEDLYSRLHEKGFAVLGFPSNDFAGQEPGSEEQIKDFCRLTYGVKFPMFEKTSVAEGNPNPLYKKLHAATGDYPEWNFHKYLIDRQGNIVGSFPSKLEPNDPRIINAINKYL